MAKNINQLLKGFSDRVVTNKPNISDCANKQLLAKLMNLAG
jgi:hypothetical protein